MKKLTLVALASVVLVGAAIGALVFTSLGGSVHAMTHKAGLCSSTHCSLAAVAAGGPIRCALDGTVREADLGSFSGDETTIIQFFADRIIITGEIPDLSGEEIEEATGVSLNQLKELSPNRLQAGVLAELSRRQFNVDSLAGASNCARFSACSIDRNLFGASGAELARYEEERAEDGRAFAEWAAPDFTLPSLSGAPVSLTDFHGENVALVFLAGHCNHCLQSLATLDQLREEYRSQGLAVVPVYINSGSVEDVHSWISALDLAMPVLIAEPRDLSERYDFSMVPTTFLIDRDGQVTRKLVGQKSKDELDEAFGELVASSG